MAKGEPPDPLLVDLWHTLHARSSELRVQLRDMNPNSHAYERLFKELVVVDTDLRRMRPWYEEMVADGWAEAGH